jgi:hypothetical protein
MPQMIADLFEGQAIGDQSRRAGVTQGMRPTVSGPDFEGGKPATDNTIDAAGYYWTPGCVHPQKYFRTGRSRANCINIACQSLGNGWDERIHLCLSPLQTEYPQGTPAPIDLIETQ